MLHSNLVAFMPEDKDEAERFAERLCAKLMSKSWVKRVFPTNDGVMITFVAGGVTPTNANRFILSVERLAAEVADGE